MSILETLQIVGTLLAALGLGGMLFFAAVFAPLVFRKLPADDAGPFIREVFPVYYTVLTVMTVLAALALWNRAEAPVLAAVAALFVFAQHVLMPRINRASSLRQLGDIAEAANFTRLHRLSVIINVAQMAALLAVVLRLLAD